jgi:hypothetical protein
MSENICREESLCWQKILMSQNIFVSQNGRNMNSMEGWGENRLVCWQNT